MTRENINKARKIIISLIATALLVMAGVTGFYYWKGLEKLPPKDEYSKSYYEFY